MGTRKRCRYCGEQAVAYRLETDGIKTPLCAYHIPIDDCAEAAKSTGSDDQPGGDPSVARQ